MADQKEGSESIPSRQPDLQLKKFHSEKQSEKIQEKKKLEQEVKSEQKKEEKEQAKEAKAEKPAKQEKKEEKKREIILQRTLTLNLSNAFKANKMERANSAVRFMREQIARHFSIPQVNIKIDGKVNSQIRKHGSGKPLKKIKLSISKDKEGMVSAELSAS